MFYKSKRSSLSLFLLVVFIMVLFFNGSDAYAYTTPKVKISVPKTPKVSITRQITDFKKPAAKKEATQKDAAVSNMIKNGSFEEKDADGMPSNWKKGSWGNNIANFVYPEKGYKGDAAGVSMVNFTDGDAKWFFDDVKVKADKKYQYSNYYKSDIDTVVMARFTLTDGAYVYMKIGAPVAAVNWQKFETSFSAPTKADMLTVFHLIQGNGQLVTDDHFLTEADADDALTEGLVSLSFDDGFVSHYREVLPQLEKAGLKGSFYVMTEEGVVNGDRSMYFDVSQLSEIRSAGHEIGLHTQTHPDLSKLSSAQMQKEIAGAKDELEALGFKNIRTIAYPYGEYNENVKRTAKEAGLIAGRTVEAGYNDKSSDPFVLKDQNVLNTTTFQDIKGWIDAAMTNKTWLILTIHQVDNNNQPYGMTPELLAQTLDYLKQSKTKVVTVEEGVSQLK